jgi:hypothetical protein
MSLSSNGWSRNGQNVGLILRALALVGDSNMQFHLSGFVRIRVANSPMNFTNFHARPVGVMRSLVDNQRWSPGFFDEFASDRARTVSPNAKGKLFDPESEWPSDETTTKGKSLPTRVHHHGFEVFFFHTLECSTIVDSESSVQCLLYI